MRSIRFWIAAALTACALAACGAQPPAPDQAGQAAPAEEAPPPAAAPAPVEEQPSPALPPAETAPAPMEAPAQTAPSTMDQPTLAPPPSAIKEMQTRSIERARVNAPPPAPGAGQPRMAERVLTPVLVELLADQARTPRQGGSAVVLLGDPAASLLAQRNLALCQSLFRTFDQATAQEVEVGVRRDAEGDVQLLRPIYWPARVAASGQAGADRCAQRLNDYDYPRAARIKSKFRLAGAGPFLVVERNDQSQTERVVAVVDLSRTRPADVPQMVRYFRDGFVQRGDIWNPQIYAPDQTRGNLTAFFGAPVNYGLLPRLVRVTQHVGCPLANLFDVCEQSG